MARKIAGASALLVFAICLIEGLAADNTMSTILSRSLMAMGCTFFVGLIIGAMAEKMMAEHRKTMDAARAAAVVATQNAQAGQAGALSATDPTRVASNALRRQTTEKMKKSNIKSPPTPDKQK